MNRIYLSLGSNLGYREENMEKAIKLIQNRVGRTETVSSFYESDPWGFSSKNRFCNCCLLVRTDLDPLPVMDLLLEIEREMGRERGGEGYSDRIIDIDLLMFDGIRMDHPRLALPHPGMEFRKFVLLPLAEIAPDLIHPVAGISISKMLQHCKDQTEVIPMLREQKGST